MFIDSHAHLQWNSFDEDREQVLERSKNQRIDSIVNIGFDIEGCKKGIALAESHSNLYATVGIHPHNADQLNQDTLSKLKELAANPKVVAIGEIGLDYFRNLSPKEVQIKAFASQLFLAQQLNLPVVIHDREAHEDVLAMLSRFKGKIKGIMHCFSGNKEIAKQCVDLGFMVSFAGNITYPKAYPLHQAAQWVDLKNLLIETDCPFLTPQDMRGKRNEPSYLPMTAQKIADLKMVSIETIAEATTKNAKTIFGL